MAHRRVRSLPSRRGGQFPEDAPAGFEPGRPSVSGKVDSTFRVTSRGTSGAPTGVDEPVAPMYEFTFNLATLEPPPPQLQHILAAAAGNKDAMDVFASLFAGVLPVPQFFAPEHLDRIMRAAASQL